MIEYCRVEAAKKGKSDGSDQKSSQMMETICKHKQKKHTYVPFLFNLEQTKHSISHTIHGTNGIFPYMEWLIFMVINVGKYTIRPMGIRHGKWRLRSVIAVPNRRLLAGSQPSARRNEGSAQSPHRKIAGGWYPWDGGPLNNQAHIHRRYTGYFYWVGVEFFLLILF